VPHFRAFCRRRGHIDGHGAGICTDFGDDRPLGRMARQLLDEMRGSHPHVDESVSAPPPPSAPAAVVEE
jgi:hypothetical protein